MWQCGRECFRAWNDYHGKIDIFRITYNMLLTILCYPCKSIESSGYVRGIWIRQKKYMCVSGFSSEKARYGRSA